MSSAPLFPAVQRLAAGESLTAADCQEAVAADPGQSGARGLTRAFLTALHRKGESADELLGAVRAIRQRMIAFDCGPTDGVLLDTCGTGGDGAETVNVSTGDGDRAGRLRRASRQARQPGRDGAVGQLRRPRPSGRCCRGRDLGAPEMSRRAGHRLPVCARGSIPGYAGWRPSGGNCRSGRIFNLVGPLCNPGQPHASARRRAGRQPGKSDGRASWHEPNRSAGPSWSPVETASTR